MIDDRLQAFGWGQLQDFVTFIKFLDAEKISIKEVIEAVSTQQLLLQQDTVRKMLTVRCPECSAEMMLRTISVPQGLRNVYGYRSAWECSKCAYEKYSTLEPHQLYFDYKNTRRI